MATPHLGANGLARTASNSAAQNQSMAEAVKKQLVIEQGSSFVFAFTLYEADGITPVANTGWSARMQIRGNYADFDTGPALVSLTDGSGITLGGATGAVTVRLTPSQTAALNFDGEAYYDLELVEATGTTHRVFSGRVELSREVSR